MACRRRPSPSCWAATLARCAVGPPLQPPRHQRAGRPAPSWPATAGQPPPAPAHPEVAGPAQGLDDRPAVAAAWPTRPQPAHAASTRPAGRLLAADDLRRRRPAHGSLLRPGGPQGRSAPAAVADMPYAIQIAGIGNHILQSSDPPIAAAMAPCLRACAQPVEIGIRLGVRETAFIESHAGAGILRTRSRPNWSISRCRSGCSSGFQPSSSSRSLSHRAATTRS